MSSVVYRVHTDTHTHTLLFIFFSSIVQHHIMLHHIVLWLSASPPQSPFVLCSCWKTPVRNQSPLCSVPYRYFSETRGVGICQSMSQLEDSGYQKQANTGNRAARKQTDFVRELEVSAQPCLTADTVRICRR